MMISRRPRNHGKAPIRHMPKVTAGLNKPPEILKNTQALTASENPKLRAIYCSCCGFAPVSCTDKPADDLILLATWQPDKAK